MNSSLSFHRNSCGSSRFTICELVPIVRLAPETPSVTLPPAIQCSTVSTGGLARHCLAIRRDVSRRWCQVETRTSQPSWLGCDMTACLQKFADPRGMVGSRGWPGGGGSSTKSQTKGPHLGQECELIGQRDGCGFVLAWAIPWRASGAATQTVETHIIIGNFQGSESRSWPSKLLGKDPSSSTDNAVRSLILPRLKVVVIVTVELLFRSGVFGPHWRCFC
ncbi:uncharacterized protein BJX67DRAFT_324435 [Aspergillus lucknowensis]|uniref:Uncharacterized protein n=1 Tax=Aspergillus lucknowensis TaxID=176173 RepID=A0ABR4LZK2_9EURO